MSNGQTFDHKGAVTTFETWDEWLHGLFSYYGKTPSDAAIKLYRDMLGRYPLADLEEATRFLLKAPDANKSTPPQIHQFVTVLRRIADNRKLRAARPGPKVLPAAELSSKEAAQELLMRLYYRAIEPPGLRRPLSDQDGPAWLVAIAKWGAAQKRELDRKAPETNQILSERAKEAWELTKGLFLEEWPQHQGEYEK